MVQLKPLWPTRMSARCAARAFHLVLAVTTMDASIAATINVRSVPGAHWEYVSAEALGWSPDLLAKAKAYSQHTGSSAVVIVKGGHVVAEWGDTARKSE